MPAYDVCYLHSMIQNPRYLFKLIARNCEDVFGVIRDYMKGEYRERMDGGNPLYLNKTPKQILGSLGIRIRDEDGISEDYDEFILEWMADIYTYMQWKCNLPSMDIVGKIPPEELYLKYHPLHEASVENGVGKLREIYFREDCVGRDGSIPDKDVKRMILESYDLVTGKKNKVSERRE